MAYFFDTIDSWCVDTKEVLLTKTQEFAQQSLITAVQMSPVLTGRFVNNWNLGTSVSNYSTIGTSTRDAKIAEIKNLITKEYMLTNGKVVMSNNVDYANKVEYDGWARTPQYAPVGRTISYIYGKYGSSTFPTFK